MADAREEGIQESIIDLTTDPISPEESLIIESGDEESSDLVPTPMSTFVKNNNGESGGSLTQRQPQSTSSAASNDGSRSSASATPVTSKVSPSTAYRFPVRVGITWRKGEKLEAEDRSRTWYPSKIVDIHNEKQLVLIHFEGWNQRYDEWVPMSSHRLRPATRHSERKDKGLKRRRIHPHPIYRAGDQVLAKWNDGKKYAAKISRLMDDGAYEVIFYDGVSHLIQAMNIQPLPDDMKLQKYMKAPPPPKPQKSKTSFKHIKVSLSENFKLRQEQKQEKSSISQLAGKILAKQKKSPSKMLLPKVNLKRDSALDEYSASASKYSPVKVKRVKKSPASTVVNIECEATVSSLSEEECRKLFGSASGQSSVSAATPSPAVTPKKKLQHSPMKKAQKLNTAEKKSKPAGSLGLSDDPTILDGSNAQRTKKRALTDSNLQPKKKKAKLTPAVEKAKSIEDATKTPKKPPPIGSVEKSKSLDLGTSTVVPVPFVQFVPAKAFVVEEDHNPYKCPYEGCTKDFRKESLLSYHIKYYHTNTDRLTPSPLPSPSISSGHPQPPAPSSSAFAGVAMGQSNAEMSGEKVAVAGLESPTLVSISSMTSEQDSSLISPRKRRRKTTSICSSDSEFSVSSKSSKSKSSKRQRHGSELSSPKEGKFDDVEPKYQKRRDSDPPSSKHRRLDVGDKHRKRSESFASKKSHKIKQEASGKERSRHDSITSKHKGQLELDIAAARRWAGSVDADVSASSTKLRSRNNSGASISARQRNDSETSSTSKRQRNDSEISVTTGSPDAIAKELWADMRQIQQQNEAVVTEEVVGPETEDEGYAAESDVINCSCRLRETNGLMIQCDVCACWQHFSCADTKKTGVPPVNYTCFMCESTPGIRDSCRFLADLGWERRGELPCFPCAENAPHGERLKKMACECHNITAVLQKLKSALHSTRRQIKISKEEDDHEFQLWQTDWDNWTKPEEDLTLTPRSVDPDPSPTPSAFLFPLTPDLTSTIPCKTDKGQSLAASIGMSPSASASSLHSSSSASSLTNVSTTASAPSSAFTFPTATIATSSTTLTSETHTDSTSLVSEINIDSTETTSTKERHTEQPSSDTVTFEMTSSPSSSSALSAPLEISTSLSNPVSTLPEDISSPKSSTVAQETLTSETTPISVESSAVQPPIDPMSPPLTGNRLQGNAPPQTPSVERKTSVASRVHGNVDDALPKKELFDDEVSDSEPTPAASTTADSSFESLTIQQQPPLEIMAVDPTTTTATDNTQKKSGKFDFESQFERWLGKSSDDIGETQDATEASSNDAETAPPSEPTADTSSTKPADSQQSPSEVIGQTQDHLVSVSDEQGSTENVPPEGEIESAAASLPTEPSEVEEENVATSNGKQLTSLYVNVDGSQEHHRSEDGEEEEDNDTDTAEESMEPYKNCELNLLVHVGRVHEDIEKQLEILEQHLTDLENAENSNPTVELSEENALNDVPALRKSLAKLARSLHKVHRISSQQQ